MIKNLINMLIDKFINDISYITEEPLDGDDVENIINEMRNKLNDLYGNV